MIGWIGSSCLAFCGLPAAIQSYKDGHSRGLNLWFLLLWTIGEILTIIAITSDAPILYLLFNYGSNLLFLSVIWYYKIWPKI